MDRDDLAAFIEQRLVDGDEVPDRGLRGRRAVFGGAQALVEGGVVGVSDSGSCSPSTAT